MRGPLEECHQIKLTRMHQPQTGWEEGLEADGPCRRLLEGQALGFLVLRQV